MNETTTKERVAGHARVLGHWMRFFTPSSGAGMLVLKEDLVQALAELHARIDEERLFRIKLHERLKALEGMK